MADNGWIKLHRKLTQSQMYRNLNSKQRDVMVQCLLLANHRENAWEWGTETYKCKPGEFITSLENLRLNCAKDVSIQSIRTSLLKLVKWCFLTDKSTKTGRLISVVNWALYQDCDDDTNKDINKEPTKLQQRFNKDLTTNKNEKNVKKEKKEENNTVGLVPRNYLSEAKEVIEYLNSKKGSKFRKPDEVIQRLKDGYTVDDCKKVIDIKANDVYFIKNPKYFCPQTLFRPSNFEKYLNEERKAEFIEPAPLIDIFAQRQSDELEKDAGYVMDALYSKYQGRNVGIGNFDEYTVDGRWAELERLHIADRVRKTFTDLSKLGLEVKDAM